MLNLLDRQTIEDLTVYRDDQDVRKFYALPDTPTIDKDRQGRPSFLFVKYVDDRRNVAEEDEKNGAYTQMRATLGIDAERTERVMNHLREQLVEEKRKGIKPFGKKIQSTEPLLARPDWTEGAVTLSTFSASEDGMVRSVAGSQKPDLSGDLGAAFALELDPAGAAIFWDAFESGNVPIVLSYELTYKARVPAAKMVIHAEREKVQEAIYTHTRPYVFKPARKRYVALARQVINRGVMATLRQTHGKLLKFMVPRKQIKTAVTNTIDVKITFGEGGGDTEVREKLMEIASDMLSNNIIPAFFAGNQVLDQITDVEEGEDLLELKDDIEESLEPFHIELSEEVAVDRNSNPSGIIQMLLTEEERQLAFREVPLSDPFFEQLDVTTRTAGVQFERDGIDSIHVFLEYDHTDAKTGERVFFNDDAVLTGDDEELTFHVERLARDADGNAITHYRIRTEIHYRVDLPKSVGRWVKQQQRQVIVAPRALGAIRVELKLTARPETVEAAEVHLAYRSGAGQVIERTITLTGDEPNQSWFQFTGDFEEQGIEPTYRYRVTWILPGGARLESETRAETRDVLEIGSPFTTPLEFTVRPEGSMEGVAEIAGELHYHDTRHDYSIVRSFSLTKLSSEEVVNVPAIEGGPRTATVEGRIVYEDGAHDELTAREVEPGTVWLGVSVRQWLTIYVQPFEADFENDLRIAALLITYTHADGRVERSPPLNFLKNGPNPTMDTTEWKVALSEGDPQTFSYTVRYIGYDGRSDNVAHDDVSDTMIWLKRPAAPDSPT
ncbi:MAG: hypothetical protein AAF799_08280 [Myxococcota bacterium]